MAEPAPALTPPSTEAAAAADEPQTVASSAPTADDEPGPVESSAVDDANHVASSVTAAPDDDDGHDVLSQRVTLADLSAKGSALYAQKHYDEACDVFSRASVLQAEINGELDPENAEILFHYGRSLFKVGQSKSDVLGGSAPTEKPAVAAAAPAAKDKAKAPKPDAAPAAEKKPLFQFTGDDNFDNDDEDEDADDDADQQDDDGDDDDLATAFEILDLARVCYLKKLEKLASDEQDQAPDSSTVRHVKERLADTHDCLAEISLENEQYPNAIDDGRISLNYKMELYPEDSEIVAEAHYKLSLALEFASITMSGDDGTNTKREAMDQGLRDDAITEMELAIKSFKLKMQAKEVDLATMASPEDNDAARRAIAEMKDVVTDMEQRLVDLRKDPIDADALGGILGGALGQRSSAEAQALADDAAKTATDLTGMVRKRAKDPPPNGKRKADDGPAASAPSDGASPKKPKLAEADAANEA